MLGAAKKGSVFDEIDFLSCQEMEKETCLHDVAFQNKGLRKQLFSLLYHFEDVPSLLGWGK